MYRITEVTPGSYYVLAYRNDGNAGVGVYTQHTAKCGAYNLPTPLPGPCPYDESLVPVIVTAGQAVNRIDIIDWSFPGHGGPYPPRPAVTGPRGYQPPSDCAYVGGPEVRPADATYWLLKCPSGLLSVALTPSLTAQGWENCGAAAGTTYWRKTDLLIAIRNFVNRADATGELGQKQRTGSCGP
jgi:hypothetical protein